MGFPKLILVATDFTETADHALDVALALARQSHGAVHLLHAYAPERAAPDELPPSSSEDAGMRLERWIDKHAGEGVRMTCSVRPGDPRAVVVDAAEGLGADMIVMGTHARTATTHSRHGSVAEAVIRAASVPVLTVRQELPRTM